MIEALLGSLVEPAAAGAAGAASGGAGGGIMNALGSASGNIPKLGSLGAVGLGVGQTIAGVIKRKKAMDSTPSVVDPNMLANYANIVRRRKMLETGTDLSSLTAANLQSMKALGKQYAMGGRMNTGALAQIMAQQAQNSRAANSDINQMYALENQASDTIAQRKFDVNMYKTAQRMAWAEQSKSAGQDNLLAALGMGGLKGDKDAG